eukprot:129608_1
MRMSSLFVILFVIKVIIVHSNESCEHPEHDPNPRRSHWLDCTTDQTMGQVQWSHEVNAWGEPEIPEKVCMEKWHRHKGGQNGYSGSDPQFSIVCGPLPEYIIHVACPAPGTPYQNECSTSCNADGACPNGDIERQGDTLECWYKSGASTADLEGYRSTCMFHDPNQAHRGYDNLASAAIQEYDNKMANWYYDLEVEAARHEKAERLLGAEERAIKRLKTGMAKTSRLKQRRARTALLRHKR